MEANPLPVEPVIKPQTPWLKIVLFSLVGLILLGGGFWAGYRCANRKAVGLTTKEEASAPPSSEDSSAPTPLVTEEPTGEWQTYYNEIYGYQVDYPKEGWEAEVLFPYTSNEEVAVKQKIVLKEFVGEGSWRDTVRIAVRNNRTSLSLTDWLKEYDPPPVRPRSLIPPEPNARIAGEAAVCIFDYSGLGVSNGWHTFFQRGQKVFQILYVFPGDEEGNFELYKHILSTFEFEDTKDIPDILPTKPE